LIFGDFGHLGDWFRGNGIRKIGFWKNTFRKMDFGKMDFRKLDLGKMDFREKEIRKNGLREIDFGILGGNCSNSSLVSLLPLRVSSMRQLLKS